MHNRTDENITVVLTTKRDRAFPLRKMQLAAEGDVTLGGLGSDLYLVEVAFPEGRRPRLRLGPFVMVQTDGGREDRRPLRNHFKAQVNKRVPIDPDRTSSTEILCNNSGRLRYHRV